MNVSLQRVNSVLFVMMSVCAMNAVDAAHHVLLR